jgi:hypothetical protein
VCESASLVPRALLIGWRSPQCYRKLSCSLKFFHRPGVLAITILCTSVRWTSADALAQQAVPVAFNMTAHSTSWALEGARSYKALYLALGMAERGECTSYGSHRLPRDEVANPSAPDTISRPIDAMTSENRTQTDESGPLLLSSLFAPTLGAGCLADCRTGPTSRLEAIRRAPDPAGASVYTLLGGSFASDSFLYGYQANYVPSKQQLAHNELFVHEPVPAPRPILRLEFGSWSLPVMLSRVAASR